MWWLALSAQAEERPLWLLEHRLELGPTFGAVTNNPANKATVFGAIADYHLADIFSLELQIAYAPPRTENKADLRRAGIQLFVPLSRTLSIIPAYVSDITFNSSLSAMYSPLYGNMSFFNHSFAFDFFFHAGGGVVRTVDELNELYTDKSDKEATATQIQFHPTALAGGGFRLCLNQHIAFRAELKKLWYIETIRSTELEILSPWIAQAGLSFFIL
jgi:outer membrane beta-barrel protein